MEQKTYTATGSLNSNDSSIILNIALPNPPSPTTFNLTYYNISKVSETYKKTINAILCQFTFEGDPGTELPPQSSSVFSLTLLIDNMKKPAEMPEVANFDFENNKECLFLFFHSTDANADDRLAFFDDLDNLYLKSQGGPFVMCPAPTSTFARNNGRPRVLSGAQIR